MYITNPILEHKSHLLKLLTLVAIILASTFFSFFIGILIGIPFFGTDLLQRLMDVGNFDNDNNIILLKIFQIVNQIGVFIVPSIFFAFLAGKNIFRYLKFDVAPKNLSILFTALLIFSILPVIHWLAQVNEGLQLPEFMSGIESWMKESEESAMKLTEAFLKNTSLWSLLVNLFMIGVLASVGEELLFRSILIRLFNDWFKNIHVAIIISSLLFSAFHLQFYGFIPRFVLGLVFGYLFVWSGSIWLPILGHFINNASAVIVYYLVNRGSLHVDAESYGATENHFVLLFGLLISIALMAGIYFSEVKRDEHGKSTYSR